MYKYLLGIIAIGLMACSLPHRKTYTADLHSWIGHSENQLYQVWGKPSQIFYVSPTEKILTYITSSTVDDNDPYRHELYYQWMGEDHWWQRIFGPPAEKQPEIYYCKTSFVVQNARITGFNFNGDDCAVNN